MSHVFISYTRADKPYLEKLVAWLKDHDFADGDLWYDHNIESGNNWREEIATALDEAYAVVVIVSAASVKSLYCTYEWAYALGQSIPILPLVFENVNFTDVPAPLASKQFVPCVEQIPVTLKEQINRLRSVPPQIEAIDRSIYNAIYDTHRLYYMLAWLEDGLIAFGSETPSEVMEYFVASASNSKSILETMMTEKAFIFTTKQHRLCWKLVDLLKDFSSIVVSHDVVFDELYVIDMDDEWLSAVEYFPQYKQWNKQIRFYFENELTEHQKMDLFTAMIRIFPMLEAHDVNLLLYNHEIRRKKKLEAKSKPNN